MSSKKIVIDTFQSAKLKGKMYLVVGGATGNEEYEIDVIHAVDESSAAEIFINRHNNSGYYRNNVGDRTYPVISIIEMKSYQCAGTVTAADR